MANLHIEARVGDEGGVKGRGEKFRDGEKKSGDSRKTRGVHRANFSKADSRHEFFFFNSIRRQM